MLSPPTFIQLLRSAITRIVASARKVGWAALSLGAESRIRIICAILTPAEAGGCGRYTDWSPIGTCNGAIIEAR